jgi:hypothetical protein
MFSSSIHNDNTVFNGDICPSTQNYEISPTVLFLWYLVIIKKIVVWRGPAVQPMLLCNDLSFHLFEHTLSVFWEPGSPSYSILNCFYFFSVSYTNTYPEVWVFLSDCLLRLFIAFMTTGIVAITLTPAITQAIISMIFNSWHSVNPPLMPPTPWLQIIVPQSWCINTPETIQKIVDSTRNIYA